MHESEKWKWSCSIVSDSATPWTAAYQAPPSMGFSRQEYWSGLPLPAPVTLWQIDGKTMETVTDFLFLGSKITADGDCSHEIKRCLLLGRKTMTNLDSRLKSRNITLLKKVHLVKAMVFPVVMYECESWTIKKLSAEKLMLLNSGVGEDSWESLGLQGDPTSQPWRKSVLNIHWKDWCWSYPILCPPDVKNWLIGKDPDAGNEWR